MTHRRKNTEPFHPKNQTGKRRLDKLAADPRVHKVWSENDGFCGENRNSIWVELEPEWGYDGSIYIHECSVNEVLENFKHIRKWTAEEMEWRRKHGA